MNTPFIEKIAALYQGISRQAPSIRFPGQVEVASNVSFNIVDGARKRMGSQYFQTLYNGNADNAMPRTFSSTGVYSFHRIERDDQEEYAIIYGSGVFQVIDINDGRIADFTADGAAKSYLSYGTPSPQQLRFTTVADVTFIVNTLRPVESTDDGEHINAATMPVKLSRTSVSGGAGGRPTFSLDLVEWKSRSKYHQILTRTAGGDSSGFRLCFGGDCTSVEIPGDASAQQVENALQGNGYDPNDFIEETTYTYFDDATNISQEVSYVPPLYESVDPNEGTIDALGITGLPAFPFGKIICTGGPLNYRPVKIRISPDLEVEDLITIGGGTGGFTGTITAGENTSDPQPRFCDMELPPEQRRITDITLIRNRLVLSTGTYMVFSQTDDFYNFYMEESPTLIDSDRFQIQIAGTEVSMIDYMIPFRRSIIVLTKSGVQYEVRGGDVLSPGTASLSPTTRYDTQSVEPAQFGDRLYMAGQAQGYSTLLEYFHDENAVSNRAAFLTKHVDDLVPPTVRRITTNPAQETVFVMPTLDGDTDARTISTANFNGTKIWADSTAWEGGVIPQAYDTTRISEDEVIQFQVSDPPDDDDGYGSDDTGATATAAATLSGKIMVYRAYTAGNERKQSAWSVWNFDDDGLQDCMVYDDELLLMRRVVAENGKVHLVLEKIDLGEAVRNETGFDVPVHLDHMYVTSAGTGNEGGESSTSWDMAAITGITGYTDKGINRVVQTDGTEHDVSLTHTSSGTTVTCSANIPHGSTVAIGRAVDSSLELSQVYVRDRESRPLRDGRTRVKKANIEHRSCSEYTATVSSTQSGAPDRVTTLGPGLGTVEGYGFTHVWVQGSSPETTVKLESNNAGPCTWTSVEWHGEYDTLTE